MKEKAAAYVAAGLVSEDQSDRIMRVIEQERNFTRVVNDVAAPDPVAAASGAGVTGRLSPAQLAALLAEREAMMQTGGADAPTDQWRVYRLIVDRIQRGEYLRLIVQASAGAGKSFLLSTVFLLSLIHISEPTRPY